MVHDQRTKTSSFLILILNSSTYFILLTKNFFHQAQLEAEIENLSWKIERAETTERDRGDIENQMDIAEKRRMILLKDFFPTISNSSNVSGTT